MGSIFTLACSCVWRLSPLHMSSIMWPFIICSLSSGMLSDRRARFVCGWCIRAEVQRQRAGNDWSRDRPYRCGVGIVTVLAPNAPYDPAWREVVCHPLSSGQQDRTTACPCPGIQWGCTQLCSHLVSTSMTLEVSMCSSLCSTFTLPLRS